MHNGNPPEYDVYNELPGFDPKIFTAYQVYDSYYHKRRAVSPFVPSYEIVELVRCIYRELINARFPELKDRVLISRNGPEILDLLLTPSGYSETLDQVSLRKLENAEIRSFRSIHGFYLCPNHGEIKINLDDVLRCGYLCPACKKEGVTLGTASPSCSDILKSLTDQQKKRLYKLDKRWSTPSYRTSSKFNAYIRILEAASEEAADAACAAFAAGVYDLEAMVKATAIYEAAIAKAIAKAKARAEAKAKAKAKASAGKTSNPPASDNL